MNKEYPNLPLIEERFKNVIKEKLLAAKKEKEEQAAKEGRKVWFAPDFSVEVFLQKFPNTAGLFSRPGTMSGQAFSDYYITVIHESNTDTYGVFQGNDPVYMVTNANENFFEDLHDHMLADMGKAEIRY